MPQEDIPLKEKLKIFLWSISIRPVFNFFRLKIKLSDFLISLFSITILAFILNYFKKLPLSLNFLSNIFLIISLFVAYLIIILIEKWKSREFIGHYRDWKGIPSSGDIHKMKINSKIESNNKNNEKLISDNNQSLPEDKTSR